MGRFKTEGKKMTKFAVLTALLLSLIVIGGCPKAIHRAVENPKVKPPEVEPNIPERSITEANIPKMNIPQTNIPEPNTSEIIIPEPNTTKVIISKPNTTKAIIPEPNTVKLIPIVTFHDKCAKILSSFVGQDGMVDYKTLHRKRLELKHLLNEFGKLDRNEYSSWPKEDKIAFWINAYNIQMLDVIVQNYPIEASKILGVVWGPYSIRHIDKNIGGISKQKFIVMDEEFTLEETEQRFFRKEFDEPRIFFALGQATISGPVLRNEPYYGNKLYEQLDDQVRKFLLGGQGFQIDRGRNIVYLSALLHPDQYGRDFISRYGTDKKFKDQEPAVRAVLNFITNYISEQDTSFLEVENYSVGYINYNWRINDK